MTETAIDLLKEIVTKANAAPGPDDWISDIALGKELGYARPKTIRRLIEPRLKYLKQIGEVKTTRSARGVTGYLLNQNQARFVTMLCRLPKARTIQMKTWPMIETWLEGKQLGGCAFGTD